MGQAAVDHPRLHLAREWWSSWLPSYRELEPISRVLKNAQERRLRVNAASDGWSQLCVFSSQMTVVKRDLSSLAS
jgi:acyl carrier protein phosphodiesterase